MANVCIASSADSDDDLVDNLSNSHVHVLYNSSMKCYIQACDLPLLFLIPRRLTECMSSALQHRPESSCCSQ
jgi:hypothetical protein